ncbi:hypothetical protein P171DRAFT_448049 [Karstenula rhodostoma CBS 690.94]|uniref:SAP domain-containing protein n=1 Tax=Karstenula rhodostoma CBS 690.94 TaxID=1392251 RepID=A0A9P4PB07_9PLEO|nr:hypothetical protein P171DRAFT_448049 [Karstenula rhodostoma CBS 690.94]
MCPLPYPTQHKYRISTPAINLRPDFVHAWRTGVLALRSNVELRFYPTSEPYETISNTDTQVITFRVTLLSPSHNMPISNAALISLEARNFDLDVEAMRTLTKIWGLHSKKKYEQLRPMCLAIIRRRAKAYLQYVEMSPLSLPRDLGQSTSTTGGPQWDITDENTRALMADLSPSQLSYLDLQVHCQERRLSNQGTRDDLADRLWRDEWEQAEYRLAGLNGMSFEQLLRAFIARVSSSA